MLRLRSSRPGLADLLGALPEEFHCIQDGPGWLVIGPTGAFMVGEAGRNVRAVGQQLAQAAARFRVAVAEELSWAPFVDVLVVSDRSRATLPAASVVESHMVMETLTDGPTLLDDAVIRRLTGLFGEYDGSEAPIAG